MKHHITTLFTDCREDTSDHLFVGSAPTYDRSCKGPDPEQVEQTKIHRHRMGREVIKRHPIGQKLSFPPCIRLIHQNPYAEFSRRPRVESRSITGLHRYSKIVTAPYGLVEREMLLQARARRDRQNPSHIGIRRDDSFRPIKYKHVDCRTRIGILERANDRRGEQHVADTTRAYD